MVVRKESVRGNKEGRKEGRKVRMQVTPPPPLQLTSSIETIPSKLSQLSLFTSLRGTNSYHIPGFDLSQPTSFVNRLKRALPAPLGGKKIRSLLPYLLTYGTSEISMPFIPLLNLMLPIHLSRDSEVLDYSSSHNKHCAA